MSATKRYSICRFPTQSGYPHKIPAQAGLHTGVRALDSQRQGLMLQGHVSSLSSTPGGVGGSNIHGGTKSSRHSRASLPKQNHHRRHSCINLPVPMFLAQLKKSCTNRQEYTLHAEMRAPTTLAPLTVILFTTTTNQARKHQCAVYCNNNTTLLRAQSGPDKGRWLMNAS